MMAENLEFTSEYAMPNEVNNVMLLFKRNIEEIDQEDFGQGRVNRIVPDYNFLNEALGMPSECIGISDIDNLDLKMSIYTPELLTILPE